MQKFKIRKTTARDRKWVGSYIKGHWGSSLIIIHGKKYFADDIDGFIALDENGAKVGLLTYEITNGDCQIVTLNSESNHIGIGTALLDNIKKYAIGKNSKRLWLITTNDNVEALRFYQRYGFIISEIRINEIENSRKYKKEIPKIGLHGIPIRDEIELEYKLKK